MDPRLSQQLATAIDLKKSFLEQSGNDLLKAVAQIVRVLKQGGKCLAFGNGGSAADAQHFAAELVGRFKKERKPLAAIALTTDSSILTAIGNDYGFEQIFARQINALGRAEDLAIAISTSGRSSNVYEAILAAKKIGMATLALTGATGGDLLTLVDLCLCVPATDTASVQEVHLFAEHLICRFLDDGESW